ncbi:glycosyltransferase [Moraxella sp. ZY210820]|uniref:glycosyltransferase n=1 Tax=unclassified Moraxella TaxID=2685852 RepID=UPI0027317E02|nr:glycosyltransferase [Moraxella sp. ZY210820]WLF83019.1 glycosyltransferase [Moraxella sp. ZY210820]
MKIIQFMASSGGVGGLEQHTFNLVNELAKQHEVHFIAHPCYAEKVASNVHFHSLDLSRSRLNIVLLWQLLSMIKKINADILHCQAGKASELVNMISVFLPNIKRVNTIHGTKKNKKVYHQKADAVIGVSKALIDGVPSHKSYVVYNGVLAHHKLSDDEITQQKQKIIEQYQLDSSFKNIICIGRLEPVKNIALLIQAMQFVQANLWIVGDGSLRQNLDLQVKSLNLQHKVAFLGYRADARDLLQCADIVALSSDREGFPLVMVEALQAEKVMVSTRVNGVVEWLPEQFLVDIGNVEQLVSVINLALKDNSQHDFAMLFKQAQQQLTVEAMAQQTVAIYQDMIKKFY